MPASIVVELAFEVVVRIGSEIVLLVGSGETRSSAITRLVVWGLAVAVCALLLFGALGQLFLEGFGWTIGLLTAGIAVAGCFATVRLADEIWRLRHWGEPTLIMSDKGLLIARSGRLIPWPQLREVTRERRGLRVKSGQRSILLPTRQPEALLRLLQDHRSRYGTPSPITAD